LLLHMLKMRLVMWSIRLWKKYDRKSK
jgi:hypothetical protein